MKNHRRDKLEMLSKENTYKTITLFKRSLLQAGLTTVNLGKVIIKKVSRFTNRLECCHHSHSVVLFTIFIQLKENDLKDNDI